MIYNTPAIAWGVVILYYSQLASDKLPKAVFSWNDKIIHFGIYFVLTSLMCLGFSRYNFKNPISRELMGRIILISLSLGGIAELIQEYAVPSRFGDWLDFLANTLGVIASAALGKLVFAKSL